MQLSELIKKLQVLQDDVGDIPVIMAADEEGNRFSSAVGLEVSWVGPYGDPLHPEDVDEEDKEDPDYTLSVVIWP